MKNNLQYRINFVTVEGLLLTSTEWITSREKIVYLADCIKAKVKCIGVSVETKAMGYVHPSTRKD